MPWIILGVRSCTDGHRDVQMCTDVTYSMAGSFGTSAVLFFFLFSGGGLFPFFAFLSFTLKYHKASCIPPIMYMYPSYHVHVVRTHQYPKIMLVKLYYNMYEYV